MSFLKRVPNLELVLYKAQQLLANDKEFVQTLADLKEQGKNFYIDFDMEVFSQMWGSTSTGFDVTDTGEPTVGGCAMTEEYTVVVHERTSDCYCVFFGEQPCYKVTNANEDFLNDLRNRSMASLSEAKKRY
jgi:hypothetical protein